MRSGMWVVVLVVAVAVIGSSQLVQAAENKSDCVKETEPCMDYMNAKTEDVPPECCVPLAKAIKESLVCVCSIYTESNFLKIMGIDSKAAGILLNNCGIDVDLVTACQVALAPPSPPPASTESPSEQPAVAPYGDSSLPGAPTTTVTTTIAPSEGTSGAMNMGVSGVVVLGSVVMWASLMV